MQAWFEHTNWPVQTAHAPPLEPHTSFAVPATQVSPLQQPAQVFAPHGSLQAPAEHFAVGEQISQPLPFVPHAELESPFSQLSSRQQPLQFAAVHVTAIGLPSGPRGASAS